MRENVGIAGWSATLRFSPAPGQTDYLKARLDDTFAGLVGKPGLTGVHLLLTDAPKGIAPTAEQRIRGSDAQADWIVIVSGYERAAIEATLRSDLTPDRLPGLDHAGPPAAELFRLAFTMTPQDL
jgi:hypothetical protein